MYEQFSLTGDVAPKLQPSRIECRLRVVKAQCTSMHYHQTAQRADANDSTGGNSEDAAL